MSRKKIVFLILLACISFFIALFVIDLFLWDVRLRKEADILNPPSSDGSSPNASLSYHSSNSFFYGTTGEGGTNDKGTIFSFNFSTKNLVKLADISNPNSDGKDPIASLTYNSSNGLFYGVTETGGNDDKGIVFSFNPTTNALKKVADISNSNSDGKKPWASLTYDGNNDRFYGTTTQGGTNNHGIIFSFNPATNALVKVADISNSNSNRIFAATDLTYYNKLFYGTTENGGVNGKGTVFSFNPITKVIVKVADISNSNSDGGYPRSILTYNSTNGLFSGTTTEGGTSSYGIVFSFNPTTNALVHLANIYNSNSNSKTPISSLSYNSSNGLFYGTTKGGGTNHKGTVFSFNPATNGLEQVANISNFNSDGTDTLDSLIYNSSNGLFYGTTSGGGTNNKGTVFSFDPR